MYEIGSTKNGEVAPCSYCTEALPGVWCPLCHEEHFCCNDHFQKYWREPFNHKDECKKTFIDTYTSPKAEKSSTSAPYVPAVKVEEVDEQDLLKCIKCGKEGIPKGKTFRPCPLCHEGVYCSTECFRANYSVHKKVCVKLENELKTTPRVKEVPLDKILKETKKVEPQTPKKELQTPRKEPQTPKQQEKNSEKIGPKSNELKKFDERFFWTCCFCGKACSKWLRCQKCFCVGYCKKECQIKHWQKEHKLSCQERGNKPIDYIEISAGKGSPLHFAARNGQYQVIQMLIKKDLACLSQGDEEGCTPLQRAAEDGNQRIATLLLNNEASIYVSDIRGETPLHKAAKGGNENLFKLFLEKCEGTWGALLRTKKLNTPIHFAAQYGHLSIVQILVETSSDLLKITNANNETPLHLACAGGHAPVVKYLVKNKANLNLLDKFSISCLHMACSSGNKEVVEFLLRRGSSIAAKDDLDGSLPLHNACARGSLVIVKLLIDYGSKEFIDTENAQGYTPLKLAKNSNPKVAKYLLEIGAKPLPEVRTEDLPPEIREEIMKNKQEKTTPLATELLNQNVTSAEKKKLLGYIMDKM